MIGAYEMIINDLKIKENTAACSNLLVGKFAGKSGNSVQSDKKQLEDLITKLKTVSATMHRECIEYVEKLFV